MGCSTDRPCKLLGSIGCDPSMEPKSCMQAALNCFTLIKTSYVVLRSCWVPMRSCSSLSLACSLACMHAGEQIMRTVLVDAMMLHHGPCRSLCVTHVHEHANSLHTRDYSPICQCCCQYDQKIPMLSTRCTLQNHGWQLEANKCWFQRFSHSFCSNCSKQTSLPSEGLSYTTALHNIAADTHFVIPPC